MRDARIVIGSSLALVSGAWASDRRPPPTLHVPSEYGSIQEAIDAASAGDRVLIQPRAYYETIDFHGKAIIVTGIAPEDRSVVERTTLHGLSAGAVVQFHSAEGRSSILRGLTIPGGNGVDGSYGGGIYCRSSSPTIDHCIIRNNTVSQRGGGVYARLGFPRLESCELIHNQAGVRGGGVEVRLGTMELIDCLIQDGKAGQGGAVSVQRGVLAIEGGELSDNHAPQGGGGLYLKESEVQLVGVTIDENRADGSGGGVLCVDGTELTALDCTMAHNRAVEEGGAVFVESGSSLRLTSCSLIANESTRGDGGGIATSGADSTLLDRSELRGNRSAGNGGGLFSIDGSLSLSNCTIVENESQGRGGGLYVNGCRAMNCTFAANRSEALGGAAHIDGSAQFVNSVFWGDFPQEIRVRTGAIQVSHCNVQGGWPGPGNLDSDPRFQDRSSGNYHIEDGSPCIDAGTLESAPEQDRDGDPRPTGAGIDIGSDEYVGPCRLTIDLEDLPRTVHRGGGLRLSLGIRNRCAEPGAFDLALLVGPRGGERVLHEGRSVEIPAGERITVESDLSLPERTPLGEFEISFELYLGGALLARRSAAIWVLGEGGGLRVPLDFPSIQSAIDAASEGDSISVWPGTYNETIAFRGKTITLAGLAPSDSVTVAETVLDAESAGTAVRFTGGEGPATVLAGLTIRGGLGKNQLPGGVLIAGASPTFIDCVIRENRATGPVYTGRSRGGGLVCINANPTLLRCRIVNNVASVAGDGGSGEGGGIRAESSHLTLVACVIAGNTAGSEAADNAFGGGLHCLESSLRLVRCIVKDNRSRAGSDWFPFASGGGINATDSRLFLSDCEIRGNSSAAEQATGGGIKGTRCEGWISDSVIAANSAYGSNGAWGGGINLYESPIDISRTILEWNSATGDDGSGGGMYISRSWPVIRNCRIEHNEVPATSSFGRGGGIYCKGSAPVFANCVIASNKGDDGPGAYCGGGTSPMFSNCVFTGNTGHGGALTIDNPKHAWVYVHNSILWDNARRDIQLDSGKISVLYSDVSQGWPGKGNLQDDPLFAGIHGFEYALSLGSPCIDAGGPDRKDGLPWPPRYYNEPSRSDMGAYGGPGAALWLPLMSHGWK